MICRLKRGFGRCNSLLEIKSIGIAFEKKNIGIAFEKNAFRIAAQRNAFRMAAQERCFSSIASLKSLQSLKSISPFTLISPFTSFSPFISISSFTSRSPRIAGMKTFVTPGAPLSKSQVEHRVIDVFRAFDKVNKEKLSLSANLITDLGLDSLDLVEVTIAVEEDFNLEIPDSVAETFKTPNDIVEFMYSLCGDGDLPEAERNKLHDQH